LLEEEFVPPVALTAELLGQLTPALARAALPGWIASHVEGAETDTLAERLSGLLAAFPDEALALALDQFQRTGEAYALYEAHPIGKIISRAYMGALLVGSTVEGLEHLSALDGRPTLVLCNHLSYVDTQATDALLAGSGASTFADALVAVAGPKVYDTPFRRFAAFCLSTVKTAQSTQLAHNEAALSPREVARIALDTIRLAQGLMRQGRPVLVYAEGSRARNGRLQPFLKGVARYALPGEGLILPLSISQADRVFALDAPTLRPHPVRLVVGAPVEVPPGDRGEAVAEAWRRIAAGLDDRHRPEGEVALV